MGAGVSGCLHGGVLARKGPGGPGRGGENAVRRESIVRRHRERSVCNTNDPCAAKKRPFREGGRSTEVPSIWQLRNQVRALCAECCVILCPSLQIITNCKVCKQPGTRQVQPTALRNRPVLLISVAHHVAPSCPSLDRSAVCFVGRDARSSRSEAELGCLHAC
jgi:hypothetical protein